MTVPTPSFDHLVAITDRFGTYEHAEGPLPRPEHGYCTDDVARVLLVVSREPNPTDSVVELGRASLRFLAEAQDATGRSRNRRRADGRWSGPHSTEDCWGRSVWALGTASAGHDERLGAAALELFDLGATRRSPWPRAMAFAALGAAAVVESRPGHARASALLEEAAGAIGRRRPDDEWPWPEDRLAYANAVLPEALLAIGEALQRPELVDDGLALLGWLLARETIDGHLSVTPVGGAGPGDVLAGFDQQPIEVAAMADACSRAFRLTGRACWSDGLDLAVRWFQGDNDSATPMWDPGTSGGFDGLERTGANQNQGAESTLALLSTFQQARLGVAAPA